VFPENKLQIIINIETKPNKMPFVLKFTFCLLFLSKIVFAQEDSISFKRRFLDTKIYKNTIVFPATKVLKYYNLYDAKAALKEYKKSRVFLLASPFLIGGGIYLGYDAIKGTPKTFTDVDGKVYPYTIRPIFQLLGGIGVFATGVCLFEFSNEFSEKSVHLYHKKIAKKSATALTFKLDTTKGLAFRLEF
jgi:hypothetical protein